ncbi:hypothetical protein PoB_001941300 [Plakobranchus ocellatus]|uniref:Uncharacterized protein n=1 Tax=Plakobranchus ocellatus TaxID=259542 RepID=A0AAV3ZE98_9GAST|nr:hypothetical protein PoB_001941300 [Plakobranchus ocellatus]
MYTKPSSQQDDLRLSCPMSGQDADAGARTCDRKVAENLRVDLLSTVSPRSLEIRHGWQVPGGFFKEREARRIRGLKFKVALLQSSNCILLTWMEPAANNVFLPRKSAWQATAVGIADVTGKSACKIIGSNWVM